MRESSCYGCIRIRKNRLLYNLWLAFFCFLLVFVKIPLGWALRILCLIWLSPICFYCCNYYYNYCNNNNKNNNNKNNNNNNNNNFLSEYLSLSSLLWLQYFSLFFGRWLFKFVFSYLFDWFKKCKIKKEAGLSLVVDKVVAEKGNQTQ